MKLADLDIETKQVIVLAQQVAKEPTQENLERLQESLTDWEIKHFEERHRNVLVALGYERKQ